MKTTREENTNKIQKICDLLRKETIEPAQQEAKEIIENAHMTADRIVKEAFKEKQKIQKNTHEEIEKQKQAAQASLAIAARQVIEDLKQKIENQIFARNLIEEIKKVSSDEKIIAHIINTLIEAIKTNGVDADLKVYIPKHVSVKKVSEHLLASIKNMLVKNEIVLGDFTGGARIKLTDKQITLDMSDKAISSLLLEYLQEDFRNLIFTK